MEWKIKKRNYITIWVYGIVEKEIMKNSTIFKREILYCEWCDSEVYTCSDCGEYFKENDQVFCSDGKHVCFDCVGKPKAGKQI